MDFNVDDVSTPSTSLPTTEINVQDEEQILSERNIDLTPSQSEATFPTRDGTAVRVEKRYRSME